MVSKGIISAITGNLQSFDRLRDAYLENGDRDNLKNCIRILLAIDALISKAEFEEIERMREREKEILHRVHELLDKIGFNRVMEILEKILALEKQMKAIVEKEILSAKSLDRRPFFERYSESDRIDIINRVLRKISQEPELSQQNIPVDEIAELIGAVYKNFVSLYDLKKEFIARVRNFIAIPMGGEEMTLARKELSIRFEDYEKQLSDEITFVITATMNAIHTLEYFRRYENVKQELWYAFHEGKIKKFDEAFRKILKEKYQRPLPLGINYKKPSKTFEEEAEGLRPYFNAGSRFDEAKKLLAYLIDFVTAEYARISDSPYHGIEHTAQNLITGIRLFKIYGVQQKHSLQQFFELCAASVFHDVGYFYSHFSSLNTRFLSSMRHVGHEKISAEYAKKVLSHFQDKMSDKETGIFPGMDFGKFLASVSNVILGTQLFGKDADESREKDLLMIIRAADLIEMCSESYVGWLLSLFVEFKVGDPENQMWKQSFMQFLKNSIGFMTSFPLTKQRVDDSQMFGCLKDFHDSKGRSIYSYNREVNVNLIRNFCEAMESEDYQLELELKRIEETE